MKILSKMTLIAAGIVAGLGLVSCDQKKTLRVYNWTYYTPKTVIAAFEQEFDCKVKLTEYESNETMFNKLINGGAKSFDIVVPSQDYVSILLKKTCSSQSCRKSSPTETKSIRTCLQKSHTTRK